MIFIIPRLYCRFLSKEPPPAVTSLATFFANAIRMSSIPSIFPMPINIELLLPTLFRVPGALALDPILLAEEALTLRCINAAGFGNNGGGVAERGSSNDLRVEIPDA